MPGITSAATARRCPHCGETHRTITNVESIAANLRKKRENLNAPAPALNSALRDGDLTMCVHCGEFSFLRVEADSIFLIAPSRHEFVTLKHDPVLNDIQRKWRRVAAHAIHTKSRVRRLDSRLRAMVAEPIPRPTMERTHVSNAPLALEIAAPVRRYQPRPRTDERPEPPVMHPFRRAETKWPVAMFETRVMISHVLGRVPPMMSRLEMAETTSANLARYGQKPVPDPASVMLWLRRGFMSEEWRIRFLVAALQRTDQHHRNIAFANCLGWGTDDLKALDSADLVDGGLSALNLRLRLDERDLREPAIVNTAALLDSAGHKVRDIHEWLDAYGQGGTLRSQDVARWRDGGYMDSSWAARLIFVLICADQISLREIISR